MAWTADIIDKYNEGNKRVHVLSCTADAATQNVDSGLEIIDHFLITAQSISTAGDNPAVYANSGAAGTSIAGTLGCSGFTSGDVFYLKVYGR